MADHTPDDTGAAPATPATPAIPALGMARPVVPPLGEASSFHLPSVAPAPVSPPVLPPGAPAAPPVSASLPVSPPTVSAPAPTFGSSLPTSAPMTSPAPVPAPQPVAPAAPVVPVALPALGEIPGLAPIAPIAPTPTSAPVPVPTVAGPAMPPPASTPGLSEAVAKDESAEQKIILDDLLNYMVEVGGSDLHLSAGSAPVIRHHGEMSAIPDYDPLTPKAIKDAIYAVMNLKQQHRFEEHKELDFAYTVPGRARFRVNVMQQRGSVGAVMRVIPWEIKPLEDLGMPDIIGTFADLPRGFVLVTGPTGSGKSTTLAAMIDKANRTRRGHIITIEDPVEFIHQHRSSIVNQREVGEDTLSFKDALKHVLRQDPDIILVGELRDLETISVALTAAETGHLVFATLHTQSAQETITRIIDVFPPEQQQQVRTQLAASLQGVVCQTLCKTKDGKGRVAAVEIMVCDSGVRANIRDGKLHQIQSALQAGAQKGMQTLNQHLANLVKAGKISYEHGLEKCSDKEDFRNLAGSPEEVAALLRRTESLGGGFGGGYMGGN